MNREEALRMIGEGYELTLISPSLILLLEEEGYLEWNQDFEEFVLTDKGEYVIRNN